MEISWPIQHETERRDWLQYWQYRFIELWAICAFNPTDPLLALKAITVLNHKVVLFLKLCLCATFPYSYWLLPRLIKERGRPKVLVATTFPPKSSPDPFISKRWATAPQLLLKQSHLLCSFWCGLKRSGDTVRMHRIVLVLKVFVGGGLLVWMCVNISSLAQHRFQRV